MWQVNLGKPRMFESVVAGSIASVLGVIDLLSMLASIIDLVLENDRGLHLSKFEIGLKIMERKSQSWPPYTSPPCRHTTGYSHCLIKILVFSMWHALPYPHCHFSSKKFLDTFGRRLKRYHSNPYKFHYQTTINILRQDKYYCFFRQHKLHLIVYKWNGCLILYYMLYKSMTVSI